MTVQRPAGTIELVARAFALALDRDDYSAAAALLADDCSYQSPKGVIDGRTAILESYRAASSWAHSHIDRVQYESSVRVISETNAVITFIDLLEHAGQAHRYSCEQALSTNQAGLISQIVHCDLPEERVRLDRFFQASGIRRDET